MFVKGISFAIQFPEVFTAAHALCLEGTLHVDELQQIFSVRESALTQAARTCRLIGCSPRIARMVLIAFTCPRGRAALGRRKFRP